MAMSKGKKERAESDGRLTDIADVVEQRVAQDRERLSNYLNKLIAAVEQTEDPLTVIGSADAVAKIGEALTRQNHLTIESMKVLSRRAGSKPDHSDLEADIGRPFEEEDPLPKDGSN